MRPALSGGHTGQEDRGQEDRKHAAKGSGQRTMTAGGFLQSSVGVFRAVGFLVNPAEAAKGTDAFKRANEEETMRLGSSVPASDVATAHCGSPGLRAAPSHNPLQQEGSLAEAQRSQFCSRGQRHPFGPENMKPDFKYTPDCLALGEKTQTDIE